MKNKRTNKIITISILVVSILVISVGFAAFTSNLVIKSTAQVNPDSGDFKVVFSNKSDSEDTNDVIPTKTPTTITASNGEIDNTTDPTLTNLQANFTEPGQKVVYSLYAYNAGKYIAYLNSVTLKGNKSCTPGEGASLELVGKACEDITVTVKVGNDSYNKTTTGITGKSIGIGESTPIEITIEYLSNGDRADGTFTVEFNDISLYYATVAGENEEYTGESGTLYTGIIYRNSNEVLNVGNNINNRWCAVVSGVASTCVENDYVNYSFNSKTECETMLEEYAKQGDLDATMQYIVANAVCEQETTPLTYETDPTNISQNYYLKHEVVNNEVTASYACITYTENGVRKDACVRGVEPTYYASNQGILRGVESYFNTLDYSANSSGKGYCTFYDSDSACDSDSLRLHADSDGHVNAYVGSLYCNVFSGGESYCR